MTNIMTALAVNMNDCPDDHLPDTLDRLAHPGAALIKHQQQLIQAHYANMFATELGMLRRVRKAARGMDLCYDMTHKVKADLAPRHLPAIHITALKALMVEALRQNNNNLIRHLDFSRHPDPHRAGLAFADKNYGLLYTEGKHGDVEAHDMAGWYLPFVPFGIFEPGTGIEYRHVCTPYWYFRVPREQGDAFASWMRMAASHSCIEHDCFQDVFGSDLCMFFVTHFPSRDDMFDIRFGGAV
jgi:hypothetical protein